MTFSFIESEDQLRYEQRGSNAVLLNQQRAQLRVAAFGDAAQIGFAAAGILSGRQARPGTKLRAVAELFEIAPLLPCHRITNCRWRSLVWIGLHGEYDKILKS